MRFKRNLCKISYRGFCCCLIAYSSFTPFTQIRFGTFMGKLLQSCLFFFPYQLKFPYLATKKYQKRKKKIFFCLPLFEEKGIFFLESPLSSYFVAIHLDLFLKRGSLIILFPLLLRIPSKFSTVLACERLYFKIEY